MANKKTNAAPFLIFVAIAGIVLAVILISSPKKTSAPSQSSDQAAVKADDAHIYRDDAPYTGNKDAGVKVVIFSDYLCPYCKSITATLDELVDKHPNDLVIYHRTFIIHPQAEVLSRAAEAAFLQGKFKEANDLIFDKYQESDESGLAQLAKDLGLDEAKFKNDLSSDTVKQKVQKDNDDAAEMQLQGTPSLFVNGEYLEDLSQLTQQIEGLLK